MKKCDAVTTGQPVGWREGGAVRETLGDAGVRRRRCHLRLSRVKNCDAAGRWRVGERDAATTFGRRCGWPLLLGYHVSRSACP